MSEFSQQPFVFIGVPVYNGGKYLGEALKSIQLQNYSNWQCVIVDNCSTDDTAIVASSYCNIDERFRYVRNDSFKTAIQNWNEVYRRSLEVENVAYFKIVAADDWIFPHYVSSMVDLMENCKTVGICSSFRIDGFSVKCDGLDYYGGAVVNGKDILYKQLDNGPYLLGSLNTVMFRKRCLDSVACDTRVYNEKNLHADTELACDILNISDFGFIFQVLSYTRRHNETGTTLAKRYRTYLLGKEINLSKRCLHSPSYHALYKEHRLRYAVFLVKRLLILDLETYKWHTSRMERKLNLKEIVGAIIRFNPASQMYFNILNRLSHKEQKTSANSGW